MRRGAMAAAPPGGPAPGPAGPAPAPAAPGAPAVDALALGAADLRFLLQRQGIDDDHLRRLFSAGVDSMDKFSAFASGEEDLLSVLKDEFRLDPATNLATRGQVASFIAAWKSAKVRVQRQAEVEAEQDTRELTKPVPTSEYLLLRQAYVKAYGTLEEKVLPSKEYLERKLLEVEHGEFKPESLQEVTTRDELDPDTLIPVWDSEARNLEGSTAGWSRGASAQVEHHAQRLPHAEAEVSGTI